MDEATCLAEIKYFTMKDLELLAILLGYIDYIYIYYHHIPIYIYIYYISLLGNKAHYITYITYIFWVNSHHKAETLRPQRGLSVYQGPGISSRFTAAQVTARSWPWRGPLTL